MSAVDAGGLGFSRRAAGRRNPLGVHAGTFVRDWSPEASRFAIEGAAQTGFDLIEIPLPTPGADNARRTVSLLDETGLDAVVSLALDPSTDITSADADTVARGERLLERAVAFAASIGAGYVGGVTFSAMTKYAHPASAEARESSLAVLTRVAGAARDAGVTVGLEYVNRYESNLLNTAAQTVRFLGELRERGAHNLLLHIDTYHANTEEVSQADAVRDAGAHLGYLHIAENHRGLLGTGSIDWPNLFDALAAADYAGPLTFESFSGAVVSAETRDDIGLWRSLWSDPVEAARHAGDFLRAQLAAARSASADADVADGADADGAHAGGADATADTDANAA